MRYKILATITIIGFSSSPVLAMEANKLTISKDKLTPTGAISQIVPIMKYDNGNEGQMPEPNVHVYTQEMNSLVPTMTPEAK